jgi:hypothetical protein
MLYVESCQGVTITILDVRHCPVFHSNTTFRRLDTVSVSSGGTCHLGPIDRASLCLRTLATTSRRFVNPTNKKRGLILSMPWICQGCQVLLVSSSSVRRCMKCISYRFLRVPNIFDNTRDYLVLLLRLHNICETGSDYILEWGDGRTLQALCWFR